MIRIDCLFLSGPFDPHGKGIYPRATRVRHHHADDRRCHACEPRAKGFPKSTSHAHSEGPSLSLRHGTCFRPPFARLHTRSKHEGLGACVRTHAAPHPSAQRLCEAHAAPLLPPPPSSQRRLWVRLPTVQIPPFAAPPDTFGGSSASRARFGPSSTVMVCRLPPRIPWVERATWWMITVF